MRVVKEFDRDKFRVLFYRTKLTQAEFAYIIGKSAGLISLYLSGYSKPKEETVLKMAKALHCDVSSLLVDGADVDACLKKEAEVAPIKNVSKEKALVVQKSESKEEIKETLAFEVVSIVSDALDLIKIAIDMLKDEKVED